MDIVKEQYYQIMFNIVRIHIPLDYTISDVNIVSKSEFGIYIIYRNLNIIIIILQTNIQKPH